MNLDAMITFADPAWLSLLPPALAAAWLLQRRPKPALAYPLTNRLAPLGSPPRDWLNTLILMLPALLLILAAAGPRWPDQATRLSTEGTAIAIVLDVSGSMAEADFPGSDGTLTDRLTAARRALNALIERRTDDAIALISFAATPKIDCPPTLDHAALHKALARLQARSGLDAGTNIGDAIAAALARLDSHPAGNKSIILLSDGEHNTTGEAEEAPLTPRQAAQLAANLGVKLHAIDCGAGDTPNRRAGQAILQACTNLTNGRYFVAEDLRTLEQAMQQIDALETTTMQSFLYRRYHVLNLPAGAAAAASWLLALWWRHRPGRPLP